MKTVLALLFTLGLSAHADNPMEAWYTCHIAPSSTEIGRIEISFAKETGTFFMMIQHLNPESIDVAQAEPVSDFTMEGYYSEKFEATVMFFNKQDAGGERKILQINHREFPLSCN